MDIYQVRTFTELCDGHITKHKLLVTTTILTDTDKIIIYTKNRTKQIV